MVLPIDDRSEIGVQQELNVVIVIAVMILKTES
jgi:hypothetical protein